MSAEPLHAVIIGGGVTGLAAAFRLQQGLADQGVMPRLALLESAPRLGGKIRTTTRDGFLIEHGPDSFVASKPAAGQLVRDLGLADDLVRSHTGQAFIARGDRLYPIPAGTMMGIPVRLGPLLRSPLLSPAGKLRVVRDLFAHGPDLAGDQPAGAFFRRRLGNEVVDRLIEPLLSGIYAGDVNHYSLQALFPQIDRASRNGRSLIRAMGTLYGHAKPAPAGNQNRGPFLTFRTGLQALTARLEERLAMCTVLRNSTASAIRKQDGHYRVELADGRSLDAHAIILALPDAAATSLLPVAGSAIPPVATLPPTSVANVVMAFPHGITGTSLDGTGFVVPRGTGHAITACTWSHLKWPHVAPRGAALLRSYIGGAHDAQLVDAPDEAIVDAVMADLRRITQLRETPAFCHVTRWKHAMPQYAVGHLDRLEQTRKAMAAALPGVFLAGASYGGVGLPDCIRQGEQAAHALVDHLTQRNLLNTPETLHVD
ncbi:MAG: protoporphyrinogen oxidase [Rhodanobacter sp.]|nr:MAG: protoporphyrinogen oxidase [Rhodanobacter sp.]TAM14131.1 MAG: protoporphyrinogen oxidase [Rhodanobacter sp.]TAM34942.1 MAG: protoporphyrinogen oxidase [Rhodanobacter sp.]